MSSPQIRSDARIDLHTHSLKSDGRGSPAQVMHEAKAAGLDVVALTDHDTTAGWAEAHETAKNLQLGFIPGIEMTTRVQSAAGAKFTVHMLAYLPNPNHPQLQTVLRNAVAGRLDRLQQITQLLAQDFDINWEHVSEVLADGKVAGRPAIADAMIARGLLETRDPFFDIVRPGTKYYVPNRDVPEPAEAVELIRSAGGVPVIAHPLARGMGPKPGQQMPREHFVELIEAGLAGFEIGHRDVSEHGAVWLASLAQEFGIFVTGSSDYHGTGKLNLLGENTTEPTVLQSIISQASWVSPSYGLEGNLHSEGSLLHIPATVLAG